MQTDFLRSGTTTSKYGLNSFGCFCFEVADIGNLKFKLWQKFRRKIRKWESINCNCKLCQQYTILDMLN